MLIPTREEKGFWRIRWGSKDNPNDVDRIRNIVKLIQKTKEDEETAKKELIYFLRNPGNELKIEPIFEKDWENNKIPVPDLRGFPLFFLKKDERNLNGVKMRHWHLEFAYLSESYLESASLFSAHLEAAMLWSAHLKSADLRYAHLEFAILRYAHFESADLSYANLKSAKLRKAHLESANLGFANLELAHLSKTYIEGADFKSAVFYKEDLKTTEEINDKFKGQQQPILIKEAARFFGTSFKPRLRHQFYRFGHSKIYMFEPRSIELPKFLTNYPFKSDKAVEFVKKKTTTFFRQT